MNLESWSGDGKGEEVAGVGKKVKGKDRGEENKKDRFAVDVGPVVLKVIEIVRCENSSLSMEERLENADCRYNEEVVVNVLKKYFKVPKLGLKFFYWVKSREGFRHSTNTFNMMINVAGEAEEFGLVEELVEEMGKSYCEKDLRTWTILVSCYGSRKWIGKALVAF
ncbi:hypothetical protein SASPL_103157 [Salvia splendens]|uniref:Pentatricopeptide repeat-containing protein n=1 Tax=Salvia splendens TaxID=180675 RepID=A0A8X8YV51_SALSN|nr:hypothetical protein SASPL_103157 [Salvia splendens]